MSRRKARIKELEKKREEREKNNWKRNQYQEMGERGILGNKELQKYSFIYESLNGQRQYFPSPEDNPTRDDYNRIKRIYNSLDSRL